LNGILRLVGLGFIQPNWLGNVRIAIFSVLIVIVWHETGFGIILFLARLMSVDPSLFEAARVDGANWLQRLWHVTLPSLKTIIEFYTVIMVITVMAWSFNYIYSMTKGGPGNSTTILEFYIYNTAFRYNNMPYASALATLLFLLVLCLIVVQTAVRQRLEATE
jgi:ABC-type sugar transport system permease subunit